MMLSQLLKQDLWISRAYINPTGFILIPKGNHVENPYHHKSPVYTYSYELPEIMRVTQNSNPSIQLPHQRHCLNGQSS